MRNVWKRCLVIMLFALLVFLTTESTAEAAKWKYGNKITETRGAFTYHAYVSKDKKKCWIYYIEIDKNKKKKAKTLAIPSRIKGKKVVRIGYSWQEIDDEDCEFFSNIFGVTVEVAHECDGYSSELKYIKKLKIPDTVEEIQETCFSGMDYIESVKIPDKVKKLNGETFYGCDRLKKVTLSKNMKEFYPIDFMDCPKLKTIKLSSKNKTYRIENGVVIQRKDSKAVWAVPAQKKVVIPEGVKSVGAYTFYSGMAKKIHIPSTVEKMEEYAFEAQSIENITISDANPYFALDGQTVYNKVNKSLAIAIVNKKGFLRISNKVTRLKSKFSVAGRGVNILVIPESVKEAEAEGFDFDRLDSMEKVYFLGKEPIKLLNKSDGYASLPIFTEVYVPKGTLETYKKWYKKHDCLDYVDAWHTFTPGSVVDMKHQARFVAE